MIKLVYKYLKPFRLVFVLGTLTKLAEAVLELWLPIFMSGIIDKGIVEQNKAYIFEMGAKLLLFSLLGFGLAVFCQYWAAVSSQGTGKNMRKALIDKISSFSYADLEKFGTSSLTNRIISDVNNIQQSVAMTMRLASRAPFLCIGAVVMSFRIDTKLTTIFLAVIPLLAVVFYFFVRASSRLYTFAQGKLDETSLGVQQALSGVRVIRAFSRKKKEKENFDKNAQELYSASVKVANISMLINPLTSIVINVATVLLLYFGASRVFVGELTQGEIFALSTYATQILYAVTIVANLVVLYTKAIASSKRINRVLNQKISIEFPRETLDTEIALKSDEAVRFVNVSFSYNGQENVLSNVDFLLKKGETLGIIGTTGCGKTTVVNLLQRFYDVSAGEVTIECKPVTKYSKKDLRAKIGVVPQKTVLFSGTIAENIRWGKSDANTQEVEQALQTAQALDFVCALQDGINTPIQEGGKNFSGGQRQRLAIARALVKKPNILIMDDSLSALDYKTDKQLRAALAKDFAKTSVVIVSQRISSVIDADNIVVLSNGVICGQGKHAHLLESCEEYRNLYETQFALLTEEAK